MKILSFTKIRQEITYLTSSDPKLGALIDLIGDYTLPLRTDYFTSLARAIVGQQLSVKAARTIWQRLLDIMDVFIIPIFNVFL